MGFKDFIRKKKDEVVTSYKRERAASKIIKEEAKVAALQERRVQAVRVAKELEKSKANRKISAGKTGSKKQIFENLGRFSDALVGPTPSRKNKKKSKTMDPFNFEL